MHRVVRALLRVQLRFFIRKVFATVSPGEAYLHNWHVDAIAHQLTRVHSGESRRLLINQPPRSLKSICVSVAYVAWLLGHDPTRRIIVVSYSGDFAAELHRQFRMVIDSQWYASVFPELRLAKETGLELVTSRGGNRYATSVGGTFTGRGADLIVVDDPLNANELHSETARKRVIDWYGGNLVTRLNDKQTGPIIVVMQRLHEDDLAGHLLRQGGWNHLNMPAIAFEDETIELGFRTHLRRSGDILHPVPISEEVKGACEILGLDPLYVANEGKLLAITAASEADRVLAAMQSHPLGREAAIIGEVTDDHPGFVMMKTRVGGKRVVDMLSGEQLPRIC